MSSADKDAEKLKHTYIAGGNAKWYAVSLENSSAVSYRVQYTLNT